jgi:hypothetical protein
MKVINSWGYKRRKRMIEIKNTRKKRQMGGREIVNEIYE